MERTEFITSTISSIKNEQQMPNSLDCYEKFTLTPIYDRNELHKYYSGKITDYDISMEYLPLIVESEKIAKDFLFDKKIRNMIKNK